MNLKYFQLIYSVTVLHPLPQGVKPSKTKILGTNPQTTSVYTKWLFHFLGSLKAGPRYDQDNVFVSHSIIGTIDEYASSRAVDKQAKIIWSIVYLPPPLQTPTVSPPSTVPPIILPKLSTTAEKQLLTASVCF